MYFCVCHEKNWIDEIERFTLRSCFYRINIEQILFAILIFLFSTDSVGFRIRSPIFNRGAGFLRLILSFERWIFSVEEKKLVDWWVFFRYVYSSQRYSMQWLEFQSEFPIFLHEFMEKWRSKAESVLWDIGMDECWRLNLLLNIINYFDQNLKIICTCWTVGVVASLMIGPPADGVVARGESNGEPELLEWLSVDCYLCCRHIKKSREKKAVNENVTINLIKIRVRKSKHSVCI